MLSNLNSSFCWTEFHFQNTSSYCSIIPKASPVLFNKTVTGHKSKYGATVSFFRNMSQQKLEKQIYLFIKI